ncbi:MAG TPA: sensor domain-containing diguanylate cyclase, partial [Polyangiales bacterium]|nr:sensor domain-containing diguanylate cyclase [Polyangiales bacterium]
ERGLLDERARAIERQTARVRYTLIAGLSTGVVLVWLAAGLLAREIRRRARSEKQLALLLQLGEMLQACQNQQEAYEVIGKLAPKFFPDLSGALFMFQASRNCVELQARFGPSELISGPTVFPPEDCWALRRGQLHLFESATGLACNHVDATNEVSSLCVPLLAQGEVIGILNVVSRNAISTGVWNRAAAVAEHVSLALANLALRETLRNQSIRDPLTGLFNRRYLEETLPREISRAARDRQALGLLMIDVDNFKRFNDSFGHEAGDHVLLEIGRLFQLNARAGDVASRMGGEELLVMLPGASLECSAQRAEQLRAAVASLTLQHRETPLGRVTISIGVAAFPQHGSTGEELMRAADAALYRAKREGRDRAVAAE